MKSSNAVAICAEYELRLGSRFGFSDEYMNYARDQIDELYKKSYEWKLIKDSDMRAIFKAMEPRLDPKR